MVLYKDLKTTHSTYNAEHLRRLKLLYKGGYAFRDNASLFLTQMASETQASFADRLMCSSYLPYMSDIIDYFATRLFAGEISITQAKDANDAVGQPVNDMYSLFIGSADLKGNSLEAYLQDCTAEAMRDTVAYIGIDFPKVEELPISLLEEDLKGTARPYLLDIEAECVIDWKLSDSGKFQWVKLKNCNMIKESPLDPPMCQEEFKLWTLENVNGQTVAKWDLYQTKLLKPGKLPSDNDDIPLVASGYTSFREIPILRLALPDGLAIGNKIGPICEDIFNRTSILVNGENKSVNAMRVIYMGNEGNAPGGAPASMVQENPFRHLAVANAWESKGFGVLGANDRIEVIESEGKAFSIVNDQIAALKENLKEVVHQMGNSVSKNKVAGKSAESKQEDRHSSEMLLTAYGNILRDFIQSIMNCISTARGEAILWKVDGLDNFSVVDRDQLITEAEKFSGLIQSSKSSSFTKLYTEKLYLALLDGVSHQDATAIKEEIAQTVDSEPEVEVLSIDPIISAPKRLTEN